MQFQLNLQDISYPKTKFIMLLNLLGLYTRAQLDNAYFLGADSHKQYYECLNDRCFWVDITTEPYKVKAIDPDKVTITKA